VEALHRRIREQVSLAFVYIAEAHSTDGWQLQPNLDEDVLIAQHTSLEERFAAARAAVSRLGLSMPVLVDGMDDAASVAFAAWPERIYVADEGGRIAYAGAPGPWGFDPDAASALVEELLG
jgi:hypothetical protein